MSHTPAPDAHTFLVPTAQTPRGGQPGLDAPDPKARPMNDHETRRLRSELTNVMRAEAIDDWLTTSQPVFGHRTPARVIADGDIAVLWAAVCGPSVAAA